MSGPGRGGCSGPGGCGGWLILGMGRKRHAARVVQVNIPTRQHDALNTNPTWFLVSHRCLVSLWVRQRPRLRGAKKAATADERR